MNKVIVTRPMVGIFAMQVCAEKDATDEEILSVCNIQNPAGTSNGWTTVVRTKDHINDLMSDNSLPVQCEKEPNRLHFLVLC